MSVKLDARKQRAFVFEIKIPDKFSTEPVSLNLLVFLHLGKQFIARLASPDNHLEAIIYRGITVATANDRVSKLET